MALTEQQELIEALSKTLEARAKALKVAQEEAYEHIFEFNGVDPKPYLLAWEAHRDIMPKLIIPEGVTYIGSYAFYNCRALTSLEIPDGVTDIGDYAFFNCFSLTSLKIPSSVTYIGERAFCNCAPLTSLNIPSSVTRIRAQAFYLCLSLASLEIPSSVTLIEEGAFTECPDTCDIHFDKPSAEVSAMSYYPWGITSGAVIHCSDGDLTVE